MCELITRYTWLPIILLWVIVESRLQELKRSEDRSPLAYLRDLSLES